MRGSAVFRTGVAPGGALAGPWVRNSLWAAARAVPSLDLRFADNKSLVDAVTGAQLVTFTRASSGTYVGSDGVLRTAVTNLLLRSEEFDSGTWSKINTTITANAVTSPTGTLTADKLVENATINGKLTAQSATLVASATYSASIYIKAAERPTLLFHVRESAYNIRFGGFFNTSTGVFTAESAGGGVLTGSSFTNIGDGWYRCTITGTLGAVTSAVVTGYLANNVNNIGYLGDGTSGLYLWGAQLEQSSTVGEYIPTTSTINSAPRFDHNPTTGESLGLLVEEQRTNLLLRSEEFNDAVWTKTLVTVSNNTETAPNGTNTADKVILNSGQSAGYVLQTNNFTSGLTYTVSCFAKAGEASDFRFVFQAGITGSNLNAVFNLSTGTLTSFSTATASIQNAGGGWYRCTATATATATVSDGVQFRTVYTGDGTSGLFLWGAQLEAGAFATSYIPTATATVTRAADVASIAGSNFSSWYNQTEGTFFVESNQASLTPASRLISASDNTTSNRTILTRASALSGNISFTVTNAGTAQVAGVILGSSLAAGTSNKVAAGYKAVDFAGSVNGLTPVTQGTGTIPGSLTQLTIGNGDALGNNPMTGTIKRLIYWPVRLQNTTHQQITQP